MSDYPEVAFGVTPTLRGWLSAVSSVAKRSDRHRDILRRVRLDIGDTVSMFTGETVSGVTLSATDGYVGVRVVVPFGQHVTVSDVSVFGSVLLPVDTLPKLPKRGASSVSVSVPVADGDGGAGSAVWNVDGTTTTVAVEAGSGRFPNIDGLIPTGDRIGFTDPAGVGSAVFGALLSVFATGAPDAPVRVVSMSETRPARFDVMSEGVEAVGIGMPVRVPGGVFGHMSESVTAGSYNGGVVLS